MKNTGMFISEESLTRIHKTALQILEKVGIRTDHPEMKERLSASGCRIDENRVFIPPELVTDCLSKVPPAFDIYGRSKDHKVHISLDETLGVNTGIFANIYDFDSGKVRRSTLDDVRLTARFLDAMENIHVIFVSLVDATEMPSHLVTVVDFNAVLGNTLKPLIGPGVTTVEEANTMINMACAVRGGDKEELRKYPNCAPFVCPVSPLRYPKKIVDALIAVADAKLPMIGLPNPVTGLTAPYTLASTLALGHAEVLGVVVMAQLLTPELPMIYQNTPSVVDMRTLSSTTGGPETGMIRQTSILLSRYVHIPGFAHGHTSSTLIDYQAGEEKGLNNLLVASARPSLLGGLGALSNTTLTSYETILLDNERYGSIFRMLRGIEVDSDHLALDVISDYVDSGTFLDSDHTIRYMRSAEVWRPRFSVRSGLINGEPAKETSVARARAEARKLMDTYHVEPLPPSVQSEIDRLVEAYDQSVAGK